MSSTTIHPSNASNLSNYIKLSLTTIVGAGTGSCICAGLVGIVNPAGGFLFGALAATITNVALPILELLCNKDKNQAMSNLLGFLIIPLHCVGSAVVASALVMTIGFPIGSFGVGMLGVASLVSMFMAGQIVSFNV